MRITGCDGGRSICGSGCAGTRRIWRGRGGVLTDGVARRGPNLWTADHWVPAWAGLASRGSRLRDWMTHDLQVLMLRRYLAGLNSEDPIVWVYHPGYGDVARRMDREAFGL